MNDQASIPVPQGLEYHGTEPVINIKLSLHHIRLAATKWSMVQNKGQRVEESR